jgi:hypothetical protein
MATTSTERSRLHRALRRQGYERFEVVLKRELLVTKLTGIGRLEPGGSADAYEHDEIEGELQGALAEWIE